MFHSADVREFLSLDNRKNAQMGNEEDQDNPEKEDDSHVWVLACLLFLVLFSKSNMYIFPVYD